MTSPQFVAEMTAQLEAAHLALQAAPDADAAALAAARVADLNDLLCRHGSDISHILTPQPAV